MLLLYYDKIYSPNDAALSRLPNRKRCSDVFWAIFRRMSKVVRTSRMFLEFSVEKNTIYFLNFHIFNLPCKHHMISLFTFKTLIHGIIDKLKVIT